MVFSEDVGKYFSTEWYFSTQGLRKQLYIFKSKYFYPKNFIKVLKVSFKCLSKIVADKN